MKSAVDITRMLSQHLGGPSEKAISAQEQLLINNQIAEITTAFKREQNYRKTQSQDRFQLLSLIKASGNDTHRLQVSTAPLLRKMAIDHLRHQYNHGIGQFADSLRIEFPNKSEFNQFIAQQSIQRTWANLTMLRSLANIFDVNLHVTAQNAMGETLHSDTYRTNKMTAPTLRLINRSNITWDHANGMTEVPTLHNGDCGPHSFFLALIPTIPQAEIDMAAELVAKQQARAQAVATPSMAPTPTPSVARQVVPLGLFNQQTQLYKQLAMKPTPQKVLDAEQLRYQQVEAQQTLEEKAQIEADRELAIQIAQEEAAMAMNTPRLR